jgi:hypothetical protein
MFKTEPSFLQKSIFEEFNENGSKYTIGGYVYDDIKTNQDDEILGGGNKMKDKVVPMGLVLNRYNENLPQMKCKENIGLVDIKLFDEFLNLNYKPLVNLTRSNKTNRSKKQTRKR